MRIRSDFWVSAYIKARNARNKPTVLMRRGAAEAGAIFIRLDRLDGTFDLFEPASQLSYKDEDLAAGERLFRCSLSNGSVFDVMDRIEREERFDPDFWLVETECLEGSHDLELADPDMK
jgi:hypothetical protein